MSTAPPGNKWGNRDVRPHDWTGRYPGDCHGSRQARARSFTSDGEALR
jgi:hypothetical protein